MFINSHKISGENIKLIKLQKNDSSQPPFDKLMLKAKI